MQHFKVEHQGIGDLETSYPHDPEDQMQTIEDYLEDMLSQGFDVQSFAFRGDTSNMVFVFRAVAK